MHLSPVLLEKSAVIFCVDDEYSFFFFFFRSFSQTVFTPPLGVEEVIADGFLAGPVALASPFRCDSHEGDPGGDAP